MHFLRIILCASFLPLLLNAATAHAQSPMLSPGPDLSPAPAKVTQVRIVRSIKIDVREIFDESNIAFFYRAVNNLKAATKEEVIRREVLFDEGDAFDQFLLEESERNLRSLPYLRQISITALDDGLYVDLVVSVQDTWTLFPFIALSSGGGTKKQAIGVTEGNLLGYGKRLELLVAEDEGRDSVEAVWDDRRLFGSYQRLTLGQFIRSDGYRSVASLGRPFRSLVEPYAWSINTDVYDLVGRLFEAGDERYVFRQKHTAVAGGYTISRGDPEELRRRYTFGYDYVVDSFDQADDEDFEDIGLEPGVASNDPALLPENQRFSGPFFAFQQVEPDYISRNYIDRFERIEDFNLGNELNIRSTFAADAFGSIRDTLLVQASDSDGWKLTPDSFLRGELGTKFRLNSKRFTNSLLSARLKYYNALGAKYLGNTYVGRHTFASSLALDWGEDLDRNVELLLGAGNGLRGYEDRTFTGDQRIVLNLEDRFHLIEDFYRLISIGGAVFLDVGGTSRKNFGEIISDNLYSNVGFGLRFGLTRSSGGTVLRVDFAFPLRDGPDGSEVGDPRILITTGQLFTAGLPSERLNEQSATVSTGFLP